MGLSSDLISQFVKVTKDDNKKNKETTSYGTIVEHNGTKYVRLDGSEVLTPITSTTDTKPGERVTVTIKNHTAIVNGNISSPAARIETVKEVEGKVIANEGYIGELKADNVTIKETLSATTGKFDTLESDVATFKETTTNNLTAITGNFDTLQSDVATFKETTTNNLTAITGSIANLDAEKADIKFANVDFADIDKATFGEFFSGSGIIKDLVVADQTIAGELVGVTIRGDSIVGETITANKLVVKGDDGLFYKLNVGIGGISPQEVPKEILGKSLHGSLIIAKSIDAEKITVKDLVAFGATIGGFNITDNSLHSGVKESVNNTSEGIYLDSQGQISIGDSGNYLKYYKDQNGEYKLLISAKSITFGTSGKDIETAMNETITKSEEEFYKSTSPTSLSGGSWSTEQPSWEEGSYIWRRTKVTYGNGNAKYTPSENGVCITGNTGAKGEDSTQLVIESSKGTVFKSDQVSTVLSVVIYKGSTRITDSTTMKSVYGNGSYLQWKYQNVNAESFSVISSSDSRLGDGGFTLTLSPTDVDTKVVFMCELIT